RDGGHRRRGGGRLVAGDNSAGHPGPPPAAGGGVDVPYRPPRKEELSHVYRRHQSLVLVGGDHVLEPSQRHGGGFDFQQPTHERHGNRANWFSVIRSRIIELDG